VGSFHVVPITSRRVLVALQLFLSPLSARLQTSVPLSVWGYDSPVSDRPSLPYGPQISIAGFRMFLGALFAGPLTHVRVHYPSGLNVHSRRVGWFFWRCSVQPAALSYYFTPKRGPSSSTGPPTFSLPIFARFWYL